MPRTIPKSYMYITGQLSSAKAIGVAAFIARLEPDFLRLLEFDPRVKSFQVYPCRIYWTDQLGTKRRYTPDCRVNFWDPQRKPCLCEIKFRSFLKTHWKELRPAFRAAVHAAALEGSRFKILTEKEIRTDYLVCVKFLLPFVRRGVDRASTERVLALMRQLKVTTPNRFMERISQDPEEQALLLPALWHAIGTFQIKADLNVPLTMDSRIESLQ